MDNSLYTLGTFVTDLSKAFDTAAHKTSTLNNLSHTKERRRRHKTLENLISWEKGSDGRGKQNRFLQNSFETLTFTVLKSYRDFSEE